MIATRAGIQVQETMICSNSSDGKEDLIGLKTRFDAYRVKLSRFVTELQSYYVKMKQLHESSLRVSNQCVI